MRKWFASFRRFGSAAARRNSVADAWKNLANGNGTVADFELAISDLVNVCNYYNRPSYSAWMRDMKSPHGFELHSALSNARTEVVQHIMWHLELSDDAKVKLATQAKELEIAPNDGAPDPLRQYR